MRLKDKRAWVHVKYAGGNDRDVAVQGIVTDIPSYGHIAPCPEHKHNYIVYDAYMRVVAAYLAIP